MAISALTDLVPIERRGRAIGAIMGAFSVASVAGVPLGGGTVLPAPPATYTASMPAQPAARPTS